MRLQAHSLLLTNDAFWFFPGAQAYLLCVLRRKGEVASGASGVGSGRAASHGPVFLARSNAERQLMVGWHLNLAVWTVARALDCGSRCGRRGSCRLAGPTAGGSGPVRGGVRGRGLKRGKQETSQLAHPSWLRTSAHQLPKPIYLSHLPIS